MGTKGELAHLARAGAELSLRVTPRAKVNAVTLTGDGLAVRVTAAPEDGKANAAVLKLLARALGVPKSRLEIVRGAAARDKVVRVLS